MLRIFSTIKYIKLLFILYYWCEWCFSLGIQVSAQHPDGSIVLDQGIVLGLKIFPETSRTAVYTYLGVPYAQAPVGSLRFAPPQKHHGWGNKTLMTRDYKPICPQLENYVFDESHNGYRRNTKTDEDCLFINIWTPQTALQYGNHSVLVIITGEEQAFDWSHNRPTGLDLAGEGVVVVSIQSRTNVFGWLSLRNTDAPGNLGLLDQRLAFEWIDENIQRFGGDHRQITLLGHGTSGATNAMLHLTSTKSSNNFIRLILMSGTIYSTYSFQSINYNNTNVIDPSMAIVKKLACDSVQMKYTLDCLRQKSVNDLLKAFENVYQHGNYTTLLGPQIDNFLPKAMQYLPKDPKMILEIGDYPNIPIIIGICSNEGAFMQELWLELAREGYEPLKKYIQTNTLPNILSHYGFQSDATHRINDMINWRFFDQIPQISSSLLSVLQRLMSETKFESPFLETIDRLTMEKSILNFRNVSSMDVRSKNSTNGNIGQIAALRRKNRTLYVYTFHISKSMDIRGSTNYFGGASHTSDLLFLMGPSLFQQIGRRKLTPTEMKLCKRMRQLFTDFVKTGNPTPGRIFDAWRPYTSKQKFIQIIGDAVHSDGAISASSMFANDFEKNTAEIENLIRQPVIGQTQIVSNVVNPYQIGPGNNQENPIDTTRMSKSYLGVYETSDYYNALTKINSFWKSLLPKMTKYIDSNSIDATNDINSRSNFDNDQLYIAAMAAGTNSKFKHAFFSMLILACLLLAVLCVCVYILKKNQRNIDTSFL